MELYFQCISFHFIDLYFYLISVHLYLKDFFKYFLQCSLLVINPFSFCMSENILLQFYFRIIFSLRLEFKVENVVSFSILKMCCSVFFLLALFPTRNLCYHYLCFFTHDVSFSVCFWISWFLSKWIKRHLGVVLFSYFVCSKFAELLRFVSSG